ncbi:MAG: DUF2220 family protein [bacterium]|nr:DUF2220 family protein [bacterium]
MIGVGEARERARVVVTKRMARWAAEIVRGEARAAGTGEPAAGAGAPSASPELSFGLKPPSEREVLADQTAAERWVREWREVPLAVGREVTWGERAWRSIGRQRVPLRLELASPDAVAEFAGGTARREWREAARRAGAVREELGGGEAMAAAVRRHFASLRRLTPEGFETLLGVVGWLLGNPQSGVRPRQIPLRGVDSKWFQRHRGLVVALHGAASGGEGLGLVDADPQIRVRILDGAIASKVRLRDFAAPLSQLRSMGIAPAAVLVVENLESALAMPQWDGLVVVHGSGYAVDVIGAIPWVVEAPVLYWGDLDSHGFAILNRLRSHHPRVESVLMDEATLLAHRDLWVPEPEPSRGTFSHLTNAEQATVERLGLEGNVRLEQERIPWAVAVEALSGVLPHQIQPELPPML